MRYFITHFTLSLLICGSLWGQNIHFTQIDFAPQSFNPALNGAFSGSYRGSILMRSQYNDPLVKGYKTAEINIDAPIIKGFRAQDWVGAGISMDKDIAGSVTFGQTFSRVGLTYHLGLDKKQTRIFSVGLQFVNISSSIKSIEDYNSKLSSGTVDNNIRDLFMGSGTGSSSGKLEQASNNWVLGTTYTQNNKTGKVVVGAAVSGIIAGTSNFKANKFSHPFNMTGFFQYKGIVNKKVLIEPTLFIQSIPSEATEVMLHSTLGYKLSKESDWILKAGLGFRTGSPSGILLAGIEKGGLKVGLSFDVPFAGYSGAYGFQNALELGASYTGLFQKTPKPKPTILCPRL